VSGEDKRAGKSGSSDDNESVDSFLRGVAHAPARHHGVGPELLPGAVVAGRFRLDRRLGEGGMGVVWAARHVVTRKPIALKFLKAAASAHPQTRQRFLREARAACAVSHPNVVEVHDVLELADGSPVMVMDLLEGESFAVRLAREGALLLPEVAQIMVPVCAAVGTAHSLGIVHRDLKPDNIFLAIAGDGTTTVKVLDFGIAKLTATEGDAAQTGTTTGTGMLLGTPCYMAPEQMFGEKDVDHRADLWAVGVILYEALAGERPTQGANVGQIFKRVTKEGIVPLREKVPSLPAPILDLVAQLLEQERANRPADLRTVIAALSQYTTATVEQFGVPRSRESDLARVSLRPPVRVDSDDALAPTLDASTRRPTWPLLGAVGLVTVTLLGLGARRSLRSPEPTPPSQSSVAAPDSLPSATVFAPTSAAIEAAETSPSWPLDASSRSASAPDASTGPTPQPLRASTVAEPGSKPAPKARPTSAASASPSAKTPPPAPIDNVWGER
jgi:eukaryotic-like serine/threonine-protein kinase